MENNDNEQYQRPTGNRNKKLKTAKMAVAILIGVLVIGLLGYGAVALFKNMTGNQDPTNTASPQETPIKTYVKGGTPLEQATYMAAGYDYDGAIKLLKEQSGYESKQDLKDAVAKFEAEKADCVPVDVTKVPHIFYHSLVNEPKHTFNVEKMGADYANGHQTWMVTTSEFDKVTKSLYDRGYVYVKLRDLVVETKNADGTVTFTKNTKLMLPKGKKAIVLSIDDLSYYHSYEKGSYPTKIVIDENGKPKCVYTNTAGKTDTGDYDVVPRLNTFLEARPDGAYKGARGLIAMTGYNGTFGYRTDVAYKTGEKLTADQKQWLTANPDFNWDKDVADAKKVAKAIKESGWEFASHTWGHISVTGKSVETLKVDNDKWKNTVENIVGKVDTVIFAHGNDISNWKDYAADNAAYNFYKSVGYNYYCNVDNSVLYWNQIRGNYVRQGRIDIDGFVLNKAISSDYKVVDEFFDAKSVLDPDRPPFKAAIGKN